MGSGDAASGGAEFMSVTACRSSTGCKTGSAKGVVNSFDFRGDRERAETVLIFPGLGRDMDGVEERICRAFSSRSSLASSKRTIWRYRMESLVYSQSEAQSLTRTPLLKNIRALVNLQT